eukprot:7887580-Pyramimonas_sp.AAC.1
MSGVLGRVVEHFRSFLQPRVRPGNRPRYRALRRSGSSIYFIPFLWLPTESASFHFEALAIRRHRPSANMADGQESEQ